LHGQGSALLLYLLPRNMQQLLRRQRTMRLAILLQLALQLQCLSHERGTPTTKAAASPVARSASG
jgi:hypothetical protein